MRDFAQFGESHCCVDEIEKDDLPGFDITGERVFSPLAQERLTETRVALNACPDGFLGISCQAMVKVPP